MTSTSIVLPYSYKISYETTINKNDISYIIEFLESQSQLENKKDTAQYEIYTDYQELLKGSLVYPDYEYNYTKYHLSSLLYRCKHQLQRVFRDCDITIGAFPVNQKSNNTKDKLTHMQLFFRIVSTDHKKLIHCPVEIVNAIQGFIFRLTTGVDYDNEYPDKKYSIRSLSPVLPLSELPDYKITNNTRLYPVFNTRTYSLYKQRSMNIPIQYVKIMIHTMLLYINGETVDNSSDQLTQDIYKFCEKYGQLDIFKDYKIYRGRKHETTSVQDKFKIDESELLFCDFVKDEKKDEKNSIDSVDRNIYMTYLDFETKRDTVQKVITGYLESCYILVVMNVNG